MKPSCFKPFELNCLAWSSVCSDEDSRSWYKDSALHKHPYPRIGLPPKDMTEYDGSPPPVTYRQAHAVLSLILVSALALLIDEWAQEELEP